MLDLNILQQKIDQALGKETKESLTKLLNDINMNKKEYTKLNNLIYKYRDEKMKDFDKPFHYQAEAWAEFQSFLKWLENSLKD